MNDSIIKVSNLDVEFKTDNNSIKALDKINLNVSKNEFICIMGVSGCGKTTLLNAIAGFIEADRGEILLKDKKISGPGPDRAVVFQDDAVFPWMNVEDNVSYSHRVKKKYGSTEKELVDKYINLVGLNEFKQAWPKELSGGMRKRVDLARGFAAEPEVLLMDEPFVSLDQPTAENLYEVLINYWEKTKTTIILITHVLKEAILLGDRILFFSKNPGTVVFDYQVKSNRNYLSVESKLVNKEYLELTKKYPNLLNGLL